MDELDAVERRRKSSARIAALVNAIVLILVPFVAFPILASMQPTGVIVRPPISPVGRFVEIATGFGFAVLVLTPFALICYWRTLSYALAYLKGERGWMAVVETGAIPAAFASVIAGPAVIIGGPLWGAAYAGFYVTAAFLIGAVLGLLLRTTAILTLKILELRAVSPAARA